MLSKQVNLVSADIESLDFFSLWQLTVQGNQLRTEWYDWFKGRVLTEEDQTVLQEELGHVVQLLGYDGLYLGQQESVWYEETDSVVEKRLAMLQAWAEQGLHISGIAGGHYDIWEGMTAELNVNYVVVTYQSKKFVFGTVHDINGSGSYMVRVLQNLCRLENVALDCGAVDSFKSAAMEMGAQFSHPQGYRRSNVHGGSCYVCSIVDVVPFVKANVSYDEAAELRDELEENSVEELRHYAVQGEYSEGQLSILDLLQQGVCVCPLYSPIAIIDFCKQPEHSSTDLSEIYAKLDDKDGFFSFLVGRRDHLCSGDSCWSCFCRGKDHLGTVLECYRKLMPFELNDDYWKLSSWFSHNKLAYMCRLENQHYMVGNQEFWKATRQPVFPNQCRLTYGGEFSDAGFADSRYVIRECLYVMNNFPLTYKQFMNNEIGVVDDIRVYCSRQQYARGDVLVIFDRHGSRICKKFRLLLANLLHGDAIYHFLSVAEDYVEQSVRQSMTSLLSFVSFGENCSVCERDRSSCECGGSVARSLRCSDCGMVACICTSVGEQDSDIPDLIERDTQNEDEGDDDICVDCRREFCMCGDDGDVTDQDGASISILRVRSNDECLWCGQPSCVCDRCDDCGRYSCVCHLIEENVDNWCDECRNFGDECVCSQLCDGCANPMSECSCVQ